MACVDGQPTLLGSTLEDPRERAAYALYTLDPWGARWREDAASESARRLVRIEIVTYGVEATHQGVGTGVISPHSRFVAQQLYGRVSTKVCRRDAH